MPPHVLGLDIGGANLKAAHTDRTALTRPFALWKKPTGLADELSQLLATMPAFEELAVTMTGELCDCFATRRDGVRAILDAVEAAAGPTRIRVWQNDGRFVSTSEAHEAPLQVASANWLALATFAGRFVLHGPALMVDMGSTTTDMVPLIDGIPRPRGRSDQERMTAGELLYTGVARTPLFALRPLVPFRKWVFRLVPELFATMRDVYVVLGDTPEEPGDLQTADGRPAMRSHARARLARHFGLDAQELSLTELKEICRTLRETQLHLLAEAISSVGFFLAKDAPAIIRCGSGEFLIQAALEHLGWTGKSISLADKLGADLSTAAPAYAVAVLAAESHP